jgi:hypothetical protein
LVLLPHAPFLFCKCRMWRSYSNSNSSNQTWKVELLFNFCLLIFFNYPCFWEMVVDNVFVFFCRNIWTLYI